MEVCTITMTQSDKCGTEKTKEVANSLGKKWRDSEQCDELPYNECRANLDENHDKENRSKRKARCRVLGQNPKEKKWFAANDQQDYHTVDEVEDKNKALYRQ